MDGAGGVRFHPPPCLRSSQGRVPHWLTCGREDILKAFLKDSFKESDGGSCPESPQGPWQTHQGWGGDVADEGNIYSE